MSLTTSLPARLCEEAPHRYLVLSGLGSCFFPSVLPESDPSLYRYQLQPTFTEAVTGKTLDGDECCLLVPVFDRVRGSQTKPTNSGSDKALWGGAWAYPSPCPESCLLRARQ